MYLSGGFGIVNENHPRTCCIECRGSVSQYVA